MTRELSTSPFPIYKVDVNKKLKIMGKNKTLEEVKDSFKKKWGDRFIYDLITPQNYVDTSTPVPIVCREHGVFLQKPSNHLFYCGCKSCSKVSRGRGGKPKKTRRRKICGIGINDSTESTSFRGERTKSYSTWKAMFRRCYSNNSIGTTYEKCEVCDEWIYYSNFEKWFNQNYKEGYHLDKDILFKGNKLYSPFTCCFVPPEINTLLVKHDATRGKLPIGVSKARGNHRYRAIVRLNSESFELGRFDTPEEAFNAYKNAKESHIQEMATKYYKEGKITERVYNALMNYKVEITD